MRNAKDFLRETIQLVATKRLPIVFRVEEGVEEKKLGESRTGNPLTVFNNKQATFEEQNLENLKHCLNAMTVQVFPNKAYKLQK
eukprot:6928726-Ditylum_brightwellii.AAC.1